jgi:nitrate reductase alpha subunit
MREPFSKRIGGKCMKRLDEVRRQYDAVYQEMVEVIAMMGGEEKIKQHREFNTELYKRLRLLQKREHELDMLEKRLSGHQVVYY